MDLVSRLKFFMETHQIVSSQFADTCKIPRPTLSQLLNGRNKKISDELIAKIHDAYPNLSVMWLMFGEGDMMITSNIQISEPENENESNVSATELTANQNNTLFDGLETNNVQNHPNNNFAQETPKIIRAAIEELNKKHNPDKATHLGEETTNSNYAKKIVNVMVFYSDNTFEQFTPY